MFLGKPGEYESSTERQHQMSENNPISQHLAGVFTPPPLSHWKLQLDDATSGLKETAQRHGGIACCVARS